MWGWLKSRGTRPGTAARGASTTGMENTLVRTLAAGIRARSGNRKGQVLHAYVQSPSPSVAGTRAIVAGGVAVDSTNRDGDTPLLIAARGGREPIVRTLIGLGANAYHRNRQGRTALHEAAEAGSLSLVRFCLTYRAMLDARDNQGNTPLHLAAVRTHVEVMECLIRAGGSPGIANYAGQTAFTVANEALRQQMANWWLETTARMQSRKGPAAAGESAKT